MLGRLHREYPVPPIYIAENGAAFPDKVSPDGSVHDPRRIAYLRDHFTQARQAMNDGADLRGYFVWSLLDNFEWANGYSKRFGLIFVDYATQQRTVKDSGKWYAQVIARNGVDPSPPSESDGRAGTFDHVTWLGSRRWSATTAR